MIGLQLNLIKLDKLGIFFIRIWGGLGILKILTCHSFDIFDSFSEWGFSLIPLK